MTGPGPTNGVLAAEPLIRLGVFAAVLMLFVIGEILAPRVRPDQHAASLFALSLGPSFVARACWRTAAFGQTPFTVLRLNMGA